MSRSAGSRFARSVVALRWLIVVAWVGGALAATTWLPTIAESQTGALGDLVPNDAEAVDAEIRSAELFGFPLLSRTVIVQRDPDGLSAAAQARVASRALALNQNDVPGFERVGGALPVTNALGVPPFSRERSTTALTFLLFAPDIGVRARQNLARRFAAEEVSSPEDALVGVTGALAARDAQADAISEALPLVELGTVLLVLLVVGVHFRALGAPLVTLLAVGVAYLVALRVMAGLGERLEVSVPAEVEPVVIVLLFGIVTDYSIFYLSRFRRKLGEGARTRTAAVATITELTPIIATAGITVVAACGALLVARLGFLQAFGPGTAIAVLVGVLAATTFLPACLAICGRVVFWPSRPGVDVPVATAAEEPSDARTGRPVRSRLVSLATSRPRLVTAGCVAALLVCATGVARLEVGNTLIRGLPEESEARAAYRAASQGFAPGIMSPTVLIFEGRNITGRTGDLIDLQRRVERSPGVAQVVGPRQQPIQRNLGAVYSRSRNAVRMLVVFDADPLGARAIEHLRRLKARMPALLQASQLDGTRVAVAGDTALAEETVRRVGDDLGRIALAVLLVVTIVLTVFLRALVAPVLLVAASVLALAAALGLTTYLFQDILDHGELTYYVPFAASVLIVALGSDYNVFLTGRIWQESRHLPFREAVAVGAARASKAITAAGIVLALSFALLGIVPIRAFRELGFAMFVGLLIDAFVVRTLLVPALITLLGRWSRWPYRPAEVPARSSADAGPTGSSPGEAGTPVSAPVRPGIGLGVLAVLVLARWLGGPRRRP